MSSRNSNMMGGIRNAIHKASVFLVNSITPVSHTSDFEKNRTLTPEEFVKAGDFLVQTFPTWKWISGETSKQLKYLPSDKQCLVTNKVPVRKAVDFEKCQTYELDDASDEFGNWVTTTGIENSQPNTSTNPIKKSIEEIPTISNNSDDDNDDDDDDDVTVPVEISNNRSYDLYISYDRFYRVPRFWLVGYESQGQPLTAEQVSSDMSHEHIAKTITWEEHPHENKRAASIHPCKHADVMRTFGDMLHQSGKEFRVDHYLIMFLKFITSIVPTIEYDYTTNL